MHNSDMEALNSAKSGCSALSVTFEGMNLTTAAAVMVPVSSIVYRDQLTGIYTVSNDHKALLRWVRLGKVSGQQAEVLSGLNASEAYISGAEGKLYNGAPVQERK